MPPDQVPGHPRHVGRRVGVPEQPVEVIDDQDPRAGLRVPEQPGELPGEPAELPGLGGTHSSGSGWPAGTNGRARSSSGSDPRAAQTTSVGSPAGPRAGSSPARTNDVRPLPRAPVTATSRLCRNNEMHCWTVRRNGANRQASAAGTSPSPAYGQSVPLRSGAWPASNSASVSSPARSRPARYRKLDQKVTSRWAASRSASVASTCPVAAARRTNAAAASSSAGWEWPSGSRNWRLLCSRVWAAFRSWKLRNRPPAGAAGPGPGRARCRPWR